MADAYIQVQPDSTGKKVDVSELTVNAQTVERQRVVIGDNSTAGNYAAVTSGGALKVDGSAATQPVAPAVASATTGTLTTSSSVVSASLSGYSHVTVSVNGTYSNIGAVFEYSDDGGTNWYTAILTRSDGSVNDLSFLLSSTARAWSGPLPGATNFRVRAIAYTSGTANIRITPSTLPATLGATTTRLSDGTNAVSIKAASTAPATSDSALVVAVSPNTPTLPVSLASVPTHAVTQSGTWTVQPGNTANTTAWLVTSRPGSTGGLTVYPRVISAATTNATNVKLSAGQLYNLQAYNLSTSNKFVKIYNKGSAAPVIGTDTPVQTHLVPPGGGIVVEWSNGSAFSNGIGFTITGAYADADTTATAVGDVILNLSYA